MPAPTRIVVIREQRKRGRGRPRLGNKRVECMVPKPVLDQLMKEEAKTGIYHTRIAANVLCNWAAKKGAFQETAL